MALTKELSNLENKELDFIRESAPEKCHWTSLLGNEHPVKCPDISLKATYGIMFDLMARLMISKETNRLFKISETRMETTSNILLDILSFKSRDLYSEFLKVYTDSRASVYKFLEVDTNRETYALRDAIIASYFFSRVYSLSNKREELLKLSLKKVRELLSRPSEDSIGYIERLIKVFKYHEYKIIDRKVTDTVYSPVFTPLAGKLNGAEADLFQNGNIIDFKCSSSLELTKEETWQLWAYYLLDCLMKIHRPEEAFSGNHIHPDKLVSGLAVYKASTGTVIKYDVLKYDSTSLSELLFDFGCFLNKKKSKDQISDWVCKNREELHQRKGE